MSSEKRNIRYHSFSPGAMSIIQMGEELIGHPSTALNELVKNGYDADAINCRIYFYYSTVSNESFAVIFDDGNGMDQATLFGDWLKPSVSKKRGENSKSERFNRSFLGSKGIGRLAAMALGETVTVVSKKENEKYFNWISLQRSTFKEEKLLSEITFPGDIIADFVDIFDNDDLLSERKCDLNKNILNFLKYESLDSFRKGTLIVIEGLDDSVQKTLYEDYNQIEIPDDPIEAYRNTKFYKSLATLITPIKLNREILKELQQKGFLDRKIGISDVTSSFSVKYGTNLTPEQSESGIDWLEVKPIPIHSVYDYRAYGKVDEKGAVKGKLSYQRLENDIFEEELEIDYKEIVNNIVPTLFEERNNNDTGEYYFDIRVYDVGERDNLEKLARLAKFDSATKFRKAFKEFQGLRISKNGFGVKPYGEEVEDWIGLSKARVQNPGQNVNTNQILGYVYFYSPLNDNLEEKTNREGFLENKAFLQVQNTISNIFRVVGRKRYNYRLLNGLGRVPKSKHQRPNIQNFINELKASDANQKIISSSEKFMKEVTTTLDNLEESLSFSERLAALGSGIELVYHELAQPISGLKTTKSSLKLKKEKIFAEFINSFMSDIDTIEHTADVLTELRKSLKPAIGRTRKKKFKPETTFLKVCNLYKSDLDEHNISISVDKRLNTYEIVDLEYAFWIAFLNIVNNAVYWIKRSGRIGEIRIKIENHSIVVSNSGPIINEQLIDHIFDYGVTTRQEKNATGLGLSFTQSTLSKINWTIYAENRDDGPAFIIKKDNNE